MTKAPHWLVWLILNAHFQLSTLNISAVGKTEIERNCHTRPRGKTHLRGKSHPRGWPEWACKILLDKSSTHPGF